MMLFAIGTDVMWSQTLSLANFDEERRKVQQQQAETRNRIVELKKLLSSYQKDVSETEKRFSELERRYQNLTREIAVREQLIEQLQTEGKQIDQEIRLTEKNLEQLEQRLESLTQRFQQSLTYLYKNGRSNELTLLLTSASINQMLIRSTYLRRFEKERVRQSEQIAQAKQELQRKKIDLVEARARNRTVQDETQDEKNNLVGRRNQQKKIIDQLKTNRRSLRKKLKEVNDDLNNLNNTLGKLIEEEERIREAELKRIQELEAERQRKLEEARKIQDAAERERAIAKYSKPLVAKKELVPSDLEEIENAFVAQKGKLPWPVDQGVISAKYGTKVHPVYRTKVENPGIEIATPTASQVKVIHPGYVLSVQPIAGYGDVIIVNHGKHKTVYGNLSQVLVRKNDYVRVGDVIALSGDENTPKGEILFFMVWEKGKNINPEHWIKPRLP